MSWKRKAVLWQVSALLGAAAVLRRLQRIQRRCVPPVRSAGLRQRLCSRSRLWDPGLSCNKLHLSGCYTHNVFSFHSLDPPLQVAIDGGAFREAGSLFIGSPDMGAVLGTAREIASAMAYLHSQVTLHTPW